MGYVVVAVFLEGGRALSVDAALKFGQMKGRIVELGWWFEHLFRGRVRAILRPGWLLGWRRRG